MTLSARQLATAEARRAKLVKICSSLPELEIQTLGEHLGMRIRKKMLAYYQFDHHGDGLISLVCKSNANEQRRLIQSDPRRFLFPPMSEAGDGSACAWIWTKSTGKPRQNY
jgi:hypothetical protein